MWVGGGNYPAPSHPNRTGGSPASGFPVRGPDGLAQALVTGRAEATHQLRKPLGSAHLFPGGPLAPATLAPGDSSSHRRAQPCGTTSVLLRWFQPVGDHHVPTSLGSTVVTRFPATTDALTPAGPFRAAHRGSLIHVTRTSNHSVSNHLRCSTRRVPLPQRWPLYFVRASPFSSRLASTTDRIEFTRLCVSRHCYGLVVRFPLLSTPGVSPRCSYVQLLALQCRPGQGLSPCCSDALSGALGLVALRRVAPRPAAQSTASPPAWLDPGLWLRKGTTEPRPCISFAHQKQDESIHRER